ncbi:hypothetical protein BN132_3155 [Cronobacter turicensis 564]|nr:hypothetical protein BN132_3155 [Cronobacter turicensis 564]
MRGAASQIAEHQPHRRPRAANHNKEGPERLHKDVRQRRALRERRLVNPEVGQPEHLQHAGDNRRAVNTRKPQQMPNQHRQQNSGQRIGRRDQRLEDSHDRLRDQQVELRLDKQAQRIERQYHHQHRDQQIERIFNHWRHLIRQAYADVMRLQKTHHLHTVNRYQNRGENPRAAEAVYWQRPFGFRRGHQHKRHQRQHRAHERVQLMRLHVVFAEVIGDSGADIDRHDPHRHIKRREDLPFKLFRQIQPRAGKAQRGVR